MRSNPQFLERRRSRSPGSGRCQEEAGWVENTVIPTFIQFDTHCYSLILFCRPNKGKQGDSKEGKSFVYIRYYSIDDFLDQDIGESTEEESIFDKAGFAKGKVEMTPEDEELYKKDLSLGIQEGREKGEGEDKGEGAGEGMIPGTTVGAVSRDEIPEIESMVTDSRKSPPLTELTDLLFELLFCEEKEEQFAAITDILAECHGKVLEKADFSQALLILNGVEELKKIISAKSEERAKLLGRISDSAVAPDSLASLRKIYSDGQVADFDTFFGYLDILGAGAFPVVAAIWEDSKFPFSTRI